MATRLAHIGVGENIPSFLGCGNTGNRRDKGWVKRANKSTKEEAILVEPSSVVWVRFVDFG